MPTRRGSIRLFRAFGITVYLHWAWLLVAYFQVKYRIPTYHSPIFGVLEYLALFAIVLIHEFGHQLACRSVGGKTNDIVLWFLGGVAYVSPPQRPAAQLWSIAAGPLVNVALYPFFSVAWWLAGYVGWMDVHPDVYHFVRTLWWINTILLVFNMLPIYPLDGGQILRSLLWFVLGRANSLLVTTILGFIGVGVLMLLAALSFFLAPPENRDSAVWLGVMCVFILLNCWGGLRHALALAKVARAPRRDGFACPDCKTPPPTGNFWRCGQCRQPFDTFETRGVCPNCGAQFTATSCPECGSLRPITAWESFGQAPPPLK